MFRSFFDWLSLQQQRPDPVGEFARHALKDKLFPRRARRLHIFLLRYEGLPDLRLQAKKAHAEWRKELRRNNNGIKDERINIS